MNNKEEFKKWVLSNLTANSGAGPAYISSVEWLSIKFYENGKIDKKSIFEINDIDVIDKLHEETKRIQRDPNSYIYNIDAPSYGDRYFYSASLSNYKKFLQLKDNEVIINKFENSTFIVELSNSGLSFSSQLITRFTASLLTKPFVILTGLSGSGKTKLAQAFAMWMCENESQYRIVPVGADWTNREPLLGFPNGLDKESYVTPDSGALQLIIRASENLTKPHFLILDEMNLSHVERYFADFLSIMESKEKLMLYSGAERIASDDTLIPNEIAWPKNLFIIGTVNIDETTYMFSPKVLDRANVLEFRVTKDQMKSYLGSNKPLDMDVLKAQGASMAEDFVQIATNDASLVNSKEISDALLEFFTELKKTGAEFGYRSAAEILRFAGIAQKIESGWLVNEIIDAAVMQKLLPKVHGSRNKLSKILPMLASFCLANDKDKVKDIYLEKFDDIKFESDTNIIYKLSFEKICRMYKNAIENGYASYAEA